MTTDEIEYNDLHAFERDLLYAVRAAEQCGDALHGLAIKDRLEAVYGEEINHGRLYQNLDDLVDAKLLEKGKKDSRTNEYTTTDQARRMLQQRTEQQANQLGLTTNGDCESQNGEDEGFVTWVCGKCGERFKTSGEPELLCLDCSDGVEKGGEH